MTSEAQRRRSPAAGGRPGLEVAADAVLLDIEGTISPVSFVRDTLFPYSKHRIADYLATNSNSAPVQDILARASVLAGSADATAALIGWQDQDIKAAPLKKLQGLIWEKGYRSGELKSPIFPDALEALRHWKAAGMPLYIYSSGSVQAQLLFFEFNAEGDLRPLFSNYFDTETGAKTVPASYLEISKSISAASDGIVFFSDNPKELDAAQSAGLQVIHVVKDDTEHHPGFVAISDFGNVTLTRRR